jgi:hypothetical protein
MHTIKPTPSVVMDVADVVMEEYDAGVASYWREGSSVLLQVSSHRRTSGEQVGASRRLEARLDRENLADVRLEAIEIASCPDIAAASGVDSESIRWYYIYAVWADLMLFITVSGEECELDVNGAWAFESIRTARRA